MAGNEEKGARLFSLVPAGGARGNGYKLKHTKFHLNTKKHFSHCGGGQTLETGISERLLSLHPWRDSKPDWTQPRATCSR